MTTQIISIFTKRPARALVTAELLAPFFQNENDTDNAHALAVSLPALLTAPFFQNVNDTDNVHLIVAIVADDLAAPFFQNVNNVGYAHTIRKITFADLTAPYHVNVNDTDNAHVIATDVDGFKYWKTLGFDNGAGVYSAIGGYEFQDALGVDLFDGARANALVRGNRTGLITATTTGMTGSASQMVDGDRAVNAVTTGSGAGTRWASFDFGSAVLLTDAWAILPPGDPGTGSWTWKGSADGITFTDVSGPMVVDGEASNSAVQFSDRTMRAGILPYRHWRLERTSATNDSFVIREFQFLLDGNAWLWDVGDNTIVNSHNLNRGGADPDIFANLSDELASTYLAIVAPADVDVGQSTQRHQFGFRFASAVLPEKLYWQQPSADFDKSYKSLRIYSSADEITWTLKWTVNLTPLASGGSATYAMFDDNATLGRRTQRVYAEVTNTLIGTGGDVVAQRVYAETTSGITASGGSAITQRAYSEISYDLNVVLGPDPNPANDHPESAALITTPPATNVQLWDIGTYRTARVYGGGVEGQYVNTYQGAMARNPTYGKKMWGYRAGMFNGGNNNTTNVTMGATAKATPLSSVSLGATGAVAKGNGSIWANGVEVAVAGTLPAMSSRDVVYYVAYDASTKKIWFGSGNASGGAITWVGDPVAGTGQSHTMTAGQGDYYYPFSQVYTQGHSLVASFDGAVSGSPNPDVGFWTPAAAPTGFSYFNAP